MANSLGREIQPGEVVVVKASAVTKGLTVEERAFICNGWGFGNHSYTGGTAVYGEWYDEPGTARIDGTDIDAYFTAQFQKRVGRFPRGTPPAAASAAVTAGRA